jgi:colanic acid biosynthesis glycosyl transferase WcaI
MKHILFITPYYPPEKAAPAVRISETAARLVLQGYQVTVLTTVPNYPTGIVLPEYKGKIVQQEMRDGVKIVRVWSYVSPNKGFLRRIVAQVSFGCLSPLLGWKAIGRPDVILVESPPLFDAIAGRILSQWKRCPFIFIVSDLWPESAVQLGILRNRLFIRLAEWLEWSTYKKASFVWSVTEGIRNSLITRGIDPERVFLLTNGVDTNKFRPSSQERAREELGWGDQFIVLYSGTHGLAHGLTTVLDAAELLLSKVDIRIILVGDGAAKADLLVQAQQRGLVNVTFLEAQPHERIPLLLAGADACLVPLRKLPLFEGALPSKMYEIMACARPMILGVEGEARTLAEKDAGAAIAIEPENAQTMADAINYLYDNPEVAATMGRQGRAFVELHFDRDILVARLNEYLIRICSPHELSSVVTTATPV